jgi:hypothetical protein
MTGAIECKKDSAEILHKTLKGPMIDQLKHMISKEVATGKEPDGELYLYKPEGGVSEIYAMFKQNGERAETETLIHTIPF